MVRALVLAALCGLSIGQTAPPLSVVHITVTVTDAEGKATPVPRHLLLLSENPASAAPKRVLTGPDGTVDVALRPGSYTIESDRAVVFFGKAYQWTRIFQVEAGKNATLELTGDNADAAPATATTATVDTSSTSPPGVDRSGLLMQWQDSVVALWTPTMHASAFLVGANGLLATSQRVIGTASSVEVQIAPAIKVTGTVLVADAARDVAILQIDPGAIGSTRPIALGCGAAGARSLVFDQDIFTIGTPMRAPKGTWAGNVSRVESGLVVSDFVLAPGSAGGPVFSVDGAVMGLTSIVDEKDQQNDRWRGDYRVVSVDDVCAVLAAAEQARPSAPRVSTTRLPVEPVRPYPVEKLKAEAQRRGGSIAPYQTSSSDFDIAFVTPVLMYAAQTQLQDPAKAGWTRGKQTADAQPPVARSLTDFGNWAAYVADLPPVLLVRMTPRMVESFWTTIARGAAMTQGVAIPAIKHVKSGFSRMRAYCGDTEVTPIHPFTIEQRVSETEVVDEGLYAFASDAFGPHCSGVKFVLYSEKEPEKGDTRTIDPKIISLIWQDFSAYRDIK